MGELILWAVLMTSVPIVIGTIFASIVVVSAHHAFPRWPRKKVAFWASGFCPALAFAVWLVGVVLLAGEPFSGPEAQGVVIGTVMALLFGAVGWPIMYMGTERLTRFLTRAAIRS